METRKYLIRFGVVIAALALLYLAERNVSPIGGILVGIGELVAEGTATTYLLLASQGLSRKSRYSLVMFFSLLFFADSSYIYLYYVKHISESSLIAILLAKLPYAAAFFFGALAPIFAIDGIRRQFFSPIAIVLAIFAIIPVVLRFMIAPLLKSFTSVPSYVIFGQTIDLVSMLVLGIVSVVVFIQSQTLSWTLYAAGTVVLVLGDWAMQVGLQLGGPPTFDVYEFFWAFGVFLSVASVLTPKLQPLEIPKNVTTQLRHSKELMLVVSFLSVGIVCLSSYGKDVDTIRIISFGAALSVVVGAFACHAIDDIVRQPQTEPAIIRTSVNKLEEHYRNIEPSIETVNEVIFLIHGIRTHAEWQEMVRRVLSSVENTLVEPIKYPLLDGFRFWFPFITRRKPINEIVPKIRFLKQCYPNAKLSVIAHSFGTYAIGRILTNNPDIRLHRLILCGSVLPLTFRWDQLGDRITKKIISDCGVRDIWPVLAESASWGYGATGTFGFGSPIFDRYHNFGHSGFFKESFVRDFWLPWFKDEQLRRAIIPPKRPYLWSFLTVFQIKWIAMGIIIIMILYFLSRFTIN